MKNIIVCSNKENVVTLEKGTEAITLRIDNKKGEVSVEATTRSGGQMIGTFKFKHDEVEWKTA